MPPQQTQSATSMLMDQLTGVSEGSLAAMAGSSLGMKSSNDIYVGLLTSRTIADAIIGKFALNRVYDAKDMTEARKTLADSTDVIPEKNGLIAVSVTDNDKVRAAGIANAYLDEFRTLTNSLAMTEASRRRLFYEEQLKQAREGLAAAALAFEQVQQEKGLVQLDAQAMAMIEGLAALRAEVAAKQVEINALRSYSTEQNPEVQLAERELASLEAEEARLEQRHNAPGIAGMGLGNVPGAGMEYLRAEHELEYRQALYDMLLKQYEAARLDESKDAAIIQVVEPAIAPDRKASPKRALILLVFAFAGLFAGSFWALLQWWREQAQADPVLASELKELRFALTRR
jgi:uncharacterized protein involved in exopolysaccharide biosynthesis